MLVLVATYPSKDTPPQEIAVGRFGDPGMAPDVLVSALAGPIPRDDEPDETKSLDRALVAWVAGHVAEDRRTAVAAWLAAQTDDVILSTRTEP